MDRHIVSFEIPTFGIAVARLDDPSLRHRPVALAQAPTPRALLQEVSREAQDEGLTAGMLVGDARRLCPGLQVLPPDPLQIRQASQRLVDVVARFAPVWEPRRPGHLFLDLTGTTRLFGPACDTAARVEREMARHHGLAGVVGVANTKLVSRIAGRLVSPLQLCEVLPGSEQTFLAPLPVATLPGLSRLPKPGVLTTLEDLNIVTVGELAEIRQQHLELVFGPQGLLLHDWAQGVDPSPVLPPLQRSRLEESLTVEPDEVDESRLFGMLYGLLERLCRELRKQQRACRCLTLSVRHSDHVVVTGRQSIIAGSHWEAELFPLLQALFRRRVRRRVRIRSMTLGMEMLTPVDGQLPLFPDEAHLLRPRRLALALDRLRERFGETSIWFGRTPVTLDPGPYIPQRGRGKRGVQTGYIGNRFPSPLWGEGRVRGGTDRIHR